MDTLRGQFLVAMPAMGDERFHEAVIYIVGHGEEGAMGLVVNQPVEDMRFADILDELGIAGKDDENIRMPSSRGFVLHSPDYFREENTYEVSDEICLTATLDILKSMASGNAPADAVFALGYCGWGAGQLENELALNGWLTVPFSRNLLFGTALNDRYDLALAQLGITRASLSGAAGHA